VDVLREERSARRFGWTSLAGWAVAGVLLVGAHAFKIATYLDDDLARMLLRLAHAHGVGLALVVLAYSVAGAKLHARATAGHLLRIGALLLPLGFALGAFGHSESDPSIGIALVPIGAALVVTALGWTAYRSFRG
jgi:hypothetical protein